MSMSEREGLINQLAKLDCSITYTIAASKISKKERIEIDNLYKNLVQQQNIVIDESIQSRVKQKEFYFNALNFYINSKNNSNAPACATQ